MAIEDRIGTDIDYNKDKLEVEGDPLEIIQPGQEEVATEFVEDDKGNMQPLMDADKPLEDFNSNLANLLSDEQLDNISIDLNHNIFEKFVLCNGDIFKNIIAVIKLIRFKSYPLLINHFSYSTLNWDKGVGISKV